MADSRTLETQLLIGSKVQGMIGNSLMRIQKLINIAQRNAKNISKIFRLWKTIIDLMSRNIGYCFDFYSISKPLINEAIPGQEKFITILKKDNGVADKQIAPIAMFGNLSVLEDFLAIQKRQVMADTDNWTQERIVRQGYMPQRASEMTKIIPRQILGQLNMQQRGSGLAQLLPGQTLSKESARQRVFHLTQIFGKSEPANNFIAISNAGIVVRPSSLFISTKPDCGRIIALKPGQLEVLRNQANIKSVGKIGFRKNMKPMLETFSLVNIPKNPEGLDRFAGAKKNTQEIDDLTGGSQFFTHSRTQSLLRGMGEDNTERPVKYPPQLITQGNRNADVKVMKEASQQSHIDFERKSNALMDRRRRLSFTGG